MHHQHENEDDLVFPRSREARPDFATLDEQLRREHEDLVGEMSSVDDSLTAAGHEPDESHLEALPPLA